MSGTLDAPPAATVFLNSAQASRALGIGGRTLRRLIDDRLIVGVRRLPNVRKTLIPKAEVERLIREAETNGGR